MPQPKKPTDETPHPTQAEDWYRGGLRFSCTQCGRCCSGAPGYVWVTKDEIERIAAFLGRPGRGLTSKHLRRVGIRYSLTEYASTGACCFLETRDGKATCAIYPVRPVQCRTWPFWDINLSSSDAWVAASVGCPGMNRGKYYDFQQIEKRLHARRVEDLQDGPASGGRPAAG